MKKSIFFSLLTIATIGVVAGIYYILATKGQVTIDNTNLDNPQTIDSRTNDDAVDPIVAKPEPKMVEYTEVVTSEIYGHREWTIKFTASDDAEITRDYYGDGRNPEQEPGFYTMIINDGKIEVGIEPYLNGTGPMALDNDDKVEPYRNPNLSDSPLNIVLSNYNGRLHHQIITSVDTNENAPDEYKHMVIPYSHGYINCISDLDRGDDCIKFFDSLKIDYEQDY